MSFRIRFDYIKNYFQDVDRELNGMIIDHSSCSLDNDFIPYHALLSGKLLTKQDKKALLYDMSIMDKARNDVPAFRNHERFFMNLSHGDEWYALKKSNIENDYRCRAGQLIQVLPNNTIVPLLLLAVDSRYAINVNQDNPDFNQFYLIINKEFTTAETHSNFYKNTKKYYIDGVSGFVNIITTTDIVKLCYKQPKLQVKPASTIAESKQNMADFNKDVLKYLQENYR